MAKYKIIPSSRTMQPPISIGHKAEKGVEAIEFDLTAWVETYGSGTLTVIMRRWGDAIPYPIALEIDENNKATWTLSDTDTAKAGMAYAQLSYIVGDEVVKKSDIYTFRVMDSLTGEGDPPGAYESWLEHLTHLAAEAMAEALDIEGIVTDKTLTVDGGIADAKAAGDALALKADKSTTYTKTEVDQMIDDVEVETDTTLEVAGAAADAAETGRQIGLLKADLEDLDERVEALESDSGGSGLSSTQKQTLMNVINALGGAFTTPSAQSLVDAFNSAWNVAVTGISLNKSTLTFSALTSETLIATLSPSDATGTVTWVSSNTSVATVDSNGTVAVVGNGTATITASCGGYSATCAVTVSGIAATYTVTYNLTGCESSNPQTRAEEGSTFTANITPVVGYLLPFTAYTVTMGGTDITASAWSNGTVSIAEVTGDIVISATATVDSRTLLYAWDLTQSLVDTVDNTEATLINTVTAGNLPTRDSSGLHFTEAGQVAQFVTLDAIASKVIEMDVASMDFKGNTSKHIRFLNNNYDNAAHSLLIRKSSDKWTAYENGWQTPTALSGQTIPSDPNAFSGHTVSCEISSSRSMTVYVDGTPIYTIPSVYIWGKDISIGGAPTGTQNDGQQIFDCTITGLRIYSI